VEEVSEGVSTTGFTEALYQSIGKRIEKYDLNFQIDLVERFKPLGQLFEIFW